MNAKVKYRVLSLSSTWRTKPRSSTEEYSSYSDSLDTETRSLRKIDAKSIVLSPFKFWPDAWRDLCRDFKNLRWRRGLSWYGVGIWYIGLLMILGVICTVTLSDPYNACQPDDSFQLKPQTFSFWGSSGFFQVTLATGDLTFTQAKVIDVIWDVVAGRGGQALLALISWRIFSQYVAICMETSPVTFKTFRTMFLQEGPSVYSLYTTIRDFCVRLRLRSKTAMVFIITTMIFILAFPTMTSAMTAYSGNVQAFIPDDANNLVQFKGFERVLYIIHDGVRINQTDDFIVIDPEREIRGNYYAAKDPVLAADETYCTNYQWLHLWSCNFVNNITQYAQVYGYGGTIQNTTSLFMNFTLPSPTLNITVFADGPRKQGGPINKYTEDISWKWQNQIYNQTYITQKGSCQTIQTYKWGFSYLQLFIMIVLLELWTTGILCMWVISHIALRTRSDSGANKRGETKAIFELADAMGAQLQTSDYKTDPRFELEHELRQRIRKDLKGGKISYPPPVLLDSEFGFRKTIWAWVKKERWWFGFFWLWAAMASSMWVINFPFAMWCAGPAGGAFFALTIGTTWRSRTFIILVCSVLSMVLSVSLGFYFGMIGPERWY
ncbi:hypothetical protein BDV96DRAFT_562683 [Lophiotrema nucula]|uniref:Uncharacterized protein n=1 Tax=Lophiotrema nucula TaxID=690887 RepID=A0A6A5ZS84_9PLEO|nr:hypothetical protein BDV96DRAFT_562683 [Lophiotrema nucula]